MDLDVSDVQCGRCRQRHAGMMAKPLENPTVIHGRAYGWWFMCPSREEPVLVSPMVTA